MRRIRACGNVLDLPHNATIVSLSPFPRNGEWGGAIRSREINQLISSVFPNSYTLYMGEQYRETLDMPDFLKHPHYQLSDVHMLCINYYTEYYLSGVPDAIIFDHPWLWTEAKKLKSIYPNIKIIHSSHNIEHTLKKDLLDGLDSDVINEISEFLYDVEVEIAQEADMIIAVKDSEADWFRQHGAKNVISANNGTNANPLPVKSEKKYTFVVGSGHPPNVSGAIKYLKDATEWLPEDTDLIVLGTMCKDLKGLLGNERNEQRNTTVRLMGKRNDDDLNSLIQSASVIMLPIPYGGGSNLKTAEGLLSGRPIVGTSISFRGFEDFMNSDNCVVTDDVQEFRDAVSFYCSNKLDTIVRQEAYSLTWEATLKPLKDFLEGK